MSEQMCLHNWWNCFVEPLIRVKRILKVGWPPLVLWLPMLMFVFRTWLGVTVVAAADTAAVVETSVMISTLKRTLRARNLSGDRYSQRNRLGLFILWMRSCVFKISTKFIYLAFYSFFLGTEIFSVWSL